MHAYCPASDYSEVKSSY